MEMQIKLLSDKAKLPSYATAGSAGMDIYSAEDVVIASGQTVLISTGISVAISEGYFGGIYARSGLATKQGLRPANCVGVIDSDYRGEIKVALHNDSEKVQTVSIGDRIAQLLIQPCTQVTLNEVSDLSNTNRGTGGFGSTGV